MRDHSSRAAAAGRWRAGLFIAAMGAVAAGGFVSPQPLAYMLVVIPVLLPAAIWWRGGQQGIPILPVISAIYFLYYGAPLLGGDLGFYDSSEVVAAAGTVGVFLVVASLACWPFQRVRGRSTVSAQSLISDRNITRVVFAGLIAGILFQLLVSADAFGWLGTFFGVVRQVALTLSAVACYLLGYARAAGLLTGRQWTQALAALIVLILLSISGLFLVGGLMEMLAAFLGYIVAAKRIPWATLATVFALVVVLHSGKGTIRQRYWVYQSNSMAGSYFTQIPEIMSEWAEDGTVALLTGDTGQSILQRASLLNMVLFVERSTPDAAPYLDGETYALLPQMLVPRFLAPDKLASQAAMELLNIHYGLESAEEARVTAIGWGLIAEAYANFGIWGVVGIGAFFGALCGFFVRLSIGAPPVSTPMFVSIAAMMALLNVEQDFSYLMVTLAQTVIAVLIAGVLLGVSKARTSALDAEHTMIAPYEP